MRLLEQDIPLPTADPQTWDGLLSDCERCVEILSEALTRQVVSLHGEAVCERVKRVLTGVVMARLWRDVRVDVMEGRGVFIPKDVADRHGLDLSMMRKALSLDQERGCDGSALDGQCNCASMPSTAMRIVLPKYRLAMHELVERTGELLKDADGRRGVLREPLGEARATLRLIRRVDYDTLSRQPQMGALARGWLKLRKGLLKIESSG